MEDEFKQKESERKKESPVKQETPKFSTSPLREEEFHSCEDEDTRRKVNLAESIANSMGNFSFAQPANEEVKEPKIEEDPPKKQQPVKKREGGTLRSRMMAAQKEKQAN